MSVYIEDDAKREAIYDMICEKLNKTRAEFDDMALEMFKESTGNSDSDIEKILSTSRADGCKANIGITLPLLFKDTGKIVEVRYQIKRFEERKEGQGVSRPPNKKIKKKR